MRALKDFLLSFKKIDLEELWDVQVRLLDKKTKLPIGGDGFTIRFFDKDINDVDLLGEGLINQDGIADVRFNPSLINQGVEDDKATETKPDVFFVVYKNGQEIYQSTVVDDVDFALHSNFDFIDGKEVNLGTWLIEPDYDR